MPTGAPNKNTVRVERYQKKAGYVSKTYKLKREVVDAFAEACEAAGVSQSAQLTALMKEFIESAACQTS